MRDTQRQRELTFDNEYIAQLQSDQRQEVVAALAALILSAMTQAMEKPDEGR